MRGLVISLSITVFLATSGCIDTGMHSANADVDDIDSALAGAAGMSVVDSSTTASGGAPMGQAGAQQVVVESVLPVPDMPECFPAGLGNFNGPQLTPEISRRYNADATSLVCHADEGGAALYLNCVWEEGARLDRTGVAVRAGGSLKVFPGAGCGPIR